MEVRTMAEESIKVSPNVITYTNEDDTKLIIEIAIPGVRKESIDLRMQDDSFIINAPRNEVEFTAAHTLCCPVNSSEAKAKYDNGLLVIEAPYKNVFENAVRIKVA